MAKLVKYIFIPFFFVFLMSHNASAVSRTIYLKNGVYAYGIPSVSGAQGGNSATPLTGQAVNIRNNIYELPAGKIWYSLAFRLEADNSYVDLSSYTDYTFSFAYCSGSTQYFTPSSNDLFRMTDYFEFDADTRTTINGSITSNAALDQRVSEKCRNVTMKGKVGTTRYNAFQLGTTANGSFTRIFSFDYNTNFTSDYPLYIVSPTVVLFDNPNEAEEALQKEKQEAQDASNNSQTSGNSSGSDSQQATSSLISIITSGIGAITSASATNCVINGNMGNFDMGSIDLCANPVPTFMQIIGSIIAALVVLPLVIVLFNRFISIIGSFQR